MGREWSPGGRGIASYPRQRLARRVFHTLTAPLEFAVAAVLDLFVADACACCSAAARSPAAYAFVHEFARPLLRPVVCRLAGLFPVRNHPVCLACAAALVPARGPGNLVVRWGGAVATRRVPRGADLSTTGGSQAGGGRSLPICAPFMTNDDLLRMVHLMKFSGYRELAPLAGTCITTAIRRHAGSWRVDAVVPVPASRGRASLAGALAAHVARDLSIRLLTNGLVKIRRTRRQSQTPNAERAENIRGAFSCRRRDLRGRRVLLVDDLITTGATAGECVGALLAAGAEIEGVATLGRAL